MSEPNRKHMKFSEGSGPMEVDEKKPIKLQKKAGRYLDQNTRHKKMIFGGIDAVETIDYALKAKVGMNGRDITVKPTCESKLLELHIPDSFWTTFLPRLTDCESSLYMDSFHDKRHLNSLETRDIGMPFLTELCRCNPGMLEEMIEVAKRSLTMDGIEDDVQWDANFMISPEEIDEHDENSAASHGVTRIHERKSFISKTGYVDECMRKTGFGHSEVYGVRVLIHRFTTDPEQKAMSWHVDDLINTGPDGEYAIATVLLPGSSDTNDKVCTEISGLGRKVDPSKGLWVPCNLMHRGVPTTDVPRRCIMLEFVAYGRNHTAAARHNHGGVKDWLGLNLSTLLEMRNVPPMSAATKGSMSYISAPIRNPYFVVFD